MVESTRQFHSAAECMLFANYLIRRKIPFSVTCSHWDNWDDDPNHHGPSESGTDYCVGFPEARFPDGDGSTGDADIERICDLITRTPDVREWERFLKLSKKEKEGC